MGRLHPVGAGRPDKDCGFEGALESSEQRRDMICHILTELLLPLC